jgi:hypothetical protein
MSRNISSRCEDYTDAEVWHFRTILWSKICHNVVKEWVANKWLLLLHCAGSLPQHHTAPRLMINWRLYLVVRVHIIMQQVSSTPLTQNPAMSSFTNNKPYCCSILFWIKINHYKYMKPSITGHVEHLGIQFIYNIQRKKGVPGSEWNLETLHIW